MMSSTNLGSRPSELSASLNLIEVKPGLKFSKAVLCNILPDIETALFFGKVYELDAYQLGRLLAVVLNTTVSQALFNQGGLHSSDLQDYVVDLLDFVPEVNDGDVSFSPDVPKGEILPQMWEMLEVEVAASIKAVAEKLGDTVNHMPGKQGQMVFRSLQVMNSKRPTIGDHKALVHHAPQKENLVILDCSGSMSANTIHTIVDDVVAMSYSANAHLAIVSNTCTYWAPGTYGSDDVLQAAEFGGTQYEQLAPLFDRDWGTVVTVADYDSSPSAKQALLGCVGSIDEVLDVSLVNRPTYLAECVGQLAAKVRPLLIAATSYVLSY
jgi:hypothetical protein